MKRNGSRAVFSRIAGRIAPGIAPGITATGLLLLIMFTFGCGIETLPYLEPPLITGTEPFPNLQHSTVNAIREFVGYDFYYRFFASQEAFDASSVNTAIVGESNLVSRGYRRMLARFTTEDAQTSGSIVRTPPVLVIPDVLKTAQLNFEVELPDGIIQSEPRVLPPPGHDDQIESLFLMRNVGPPASPEALSFLESFSPADQHDLSSIGLSNTSLDQITIAIYVIAVGYDFEVFAPIRSAPVFGGLTTFIPN